ncbi:MAG: DUF2188 domain-containing protein [Candidatus Aminicenantes bacterium]|nr:DUF2188 domain-containing protein [Candidatus Aminicenantes bacterium]NIM81600.1 DUF2188 domain-containing protein [Candidatus Aminicenantes bacterium]NIN20971.1 DUF2188 domain-containing protein [Candidatus Aminicenantes bacterium]NIN44792.1 DUF2188 domain-containing protein [Candidatus Aminicenantes bacterium]NIN87600.1 DUF2188 domain-containing protein [Candidatus Aminicenantes bacterium]
MSMIEDVSNTKKKRVHIIKRANNWALIKQGAVRATRLYRSKQEAVRNAQKLRKKGYDLVIHKKDGSVQRWEESEAISH